jgi:predicted nucleic acid-binding protein
VVIVDTSVWIDVLRDGSGRERDALRAAVGDGDLVLTRFTQMELLQGARNEREWGLLSQHLETQTYAEAQSSTWPDAARTYFDLRRTGQTVRSPIDCCIAQIAIDHGFLLLHRDRDFEIISAMRPLREMRLPAPD